MWLDGLRRRNSREIGLDDSWASFCCYAVIGAAAPIIIVLVDAIQHTVEETIMAQKSKLRDHAAL
jgi:hypothetical protein